MIGGRLLVESPLSFVVFAVLRCEHDDDAAWYDRIDHQDDDDDDDDDPHLMMMEVRLW